MGVYHLNSSNPRDANARGMWADSGAVVFHEQLVSCYVLGIKTQI